MSKDYPHGVIKGHLPETDITIENSWCLQSPSDYIEVMCELTHGAIAELGADSIAAIGTDFTNCTVVGIKENGLPLCNYEEFKNEPHAWVKLWKHHAAQAHAERIEMALREAAVPWLSEYGNNVSSEWFFPKLLQTYEEAPDVFAACDYYLEAADYIVYFLTGQIVRNSATLGVNAFYSSERGFPSKELLNSFSKGFGDAVYPKLQGKILPVGSRAGKLCASAAQLLGLNENVIVSVGHGDSEVACAGLGATKSGSMLMVMGTSTCYQMIYDKKLCFDGVCAIVEDGMIPELVSYESGQPAVGDAFAWYADNMMPAEYVKKASEQSMSRLEYMNMLASQILPGETGLVSLDWMNGNRSVLMDYSLKSFFAGLSLETKPEAIFRSMIEATAFGAKKIIEGYENAGVHIEQLLAVGGLSLKSPLTMQIYADVLGREISVTSISNVCALGACVCGAVALKNEKGSRVAFEEEAQRLVHGSEKLYSPNEKAAEIYNKLYNVYCKLHDFAGITSNICGELNSIQRISKEIFEK